MIKRTLKCLQGTGQAPAAAPQGAGGQFVTFDPSGSTYTSPAGITPDGTIAGFYNDASGVEHGFLRTPTGGFTAFDPPGSTLTSVNFMSTNGEIVGVYCDTAACALQGGFVGAHGFVRARDGTFTTFDAPAPSSDIPPFVLGLPWPPSINPAGAVAGTYIDGSGNSHGFLRAKNGAFTTIDAPGFTGDTNILAINPSGVMIGEACCFAGFIRYPNGSFTTIEIPEGGCGNILPTDINPAGTITGEYSDPSNCEVSHSFVRAPDGTVTTFDAPGFSSTQGVAINPAGWITGLAFDFVFPFQGFYGFLRSPDGAITTFVAPGAIWTWPTGINPAGAITGFLLDANFVSHGFLRSP